MGSAKAAEYRDSLMPSLLHLISKIEATIQICLEPFLVGNGRTLPKFRPCGTHYFDFNIPNIHSGSSIFYKIISI